MDTLKNVTNTLSENKEEIIRKIPRREEFGKLNIINQ